MSKKLQALNEVTSANDSDLLYLVRNTNGVYIDHKIAKSNLIGTIPVDSGGGVDRITRTINCADLPVTGACYNLVNTNSTLALDPNGLKITLGSTTNDLVSFYLENQGVPNIYDRNPEIIVHLDATNFTSEQTMTISFGKEGAWNAKGFGISIQGADSYGSCGTGSQTFEELVMGNWGDKAKKEVRIKLTSGEKCEWFVNGILKKTCADTIYLPTGDATILGHFMVKNGGTNAGKYAKVRDIIVSYDAIDPQLGQ